MRKDNLILSTPHGSDKTPLTLSKKIITVK